MIVQIVIGDGAIAILVVQTISIVKARSSSLDAFRLRALLWVFK